MLPLTVERFSSRPPLPIVPRRRRGPSVLVTLTGNSEVRLPFNHYSLRKFHLLGRLGDLLHFRPRRARKWDS
jgi:hypothetical protein